MGKNKFDKDTIVGMIAALVIGIIIFSVCGDSGSSSSKSSSKKSYAQQYGYDVEDFYYKGSNGKWYKK